ncbi:ATP-binding cassette domain-containing protein [Streptomyces sp. RKAG293]|uniref:ATP-binding cassette domain-containing protein n=1 Tax=Streptomyces sp. RKAG293 TaxID=2893403 RepID=UPI0020336C94|nr:ATP-binding cassette domain-containing protein [Streptomyces sp. RKAG293]MCM2423106.1 ATP-binding cassette domain-containing protein [Streptomyces sp. RKAG293]
MTPTQQAERTRTADATAALNATAAANRATLAAALDGLGPAARRPSREARAVAVPPPDPAAHALAVLAALGPALGIEVPAELPAAVRTARDPLIALLRRLGVRWRQVTLPAAKAPKGAKSSDGDHVHGDPGGTAGAMIAFASDDGRPLALVPRGRGHLVCDPAAPDAGRARRRPAGPACSRQALLLYRPLPPGTPTPGSLLRFALGAPGTRRDLVVLAGAGLLTAVLTLLVPLSAGLLMPRLLAADRHPLRWLALLLGAASAAGLLLLLVRNTAAVRLTGRIQAALEPAVWDRLLTHDARFFRDFSTGDLVHRANAVAEARQALSEVLVSAVLGAFFSLSGLLLLLTVDLRLGGVLLLAAVAAVTVLLLLGRRRQRYESEVYALHGRLHGVLYGLLLGIDKLQTAGREIQAFARWAGPFARQKRADAAAMRADAASGAVTAALQPLLLAVLLAAAAAGGAGSVSAGHLMAAGIAAGQVALALGQLTHAAATAYGIAPVLDRLRPVLAAPAVPASGPHRRDPGVLGGAVALEEVTFRYPGAAVPALDRVSLRAEEGEFVAVVGPSGAGKSTLIRLILGFDIPESGTVRHDGQDLAALDLRLVCGQLGTVLQNGRTLRGNLLENLAGTDPDVSEDDVWAAAEQAGIAAELRALPLGLGTRIGEDAQGFSGGQIQRILLARALVRRPAVLLLDEATSALDNATQAHVADAVAALDRTRIVIAHRLSTIRRADRIHVLDAGRVTASGTYDELLDHDPLFTRLVRPQEI